MQVMQMTLEEWRTLLSAKRKVMMADVAIVDGVMVKNRYGEPGKRVGNVLVVFDEEEL